MERAKDFSHICLTPMDMTLPLMTKISAGMRIQRYLWLLNQSKVQQIHVANCIKESWDQPQRDCESASNQNQ